MDILATHDGKFLIGVIRFFEFKWNKDRTLSVWSKDKDTVVNVETDRGIFIEALDAIGDVFATGGDGNWFMVRLSKEPVKLRHRKLPDPKLSAAAIEKARQKTTVTVANHERHDGGPFNFGASYMDGTLDKVIKSLEKIRASIPAKYRSKARCGIDSNSGYEGSHYAHIEVTYQRPESDGEVIERVKIERERARLAEMTDRATLKRLQEKLAVA